jgi:hypothetical protein
MLVADIVKTVNQKETLDGLLLHGVVRSVINTPSEFSGVVLSSGEFAILDLYAVTCKEENHFGETKSTMLTPQGSIVFILDDRSLIGKLVTIKGSGYKGYVKLRKQKSESKIVGFNCLEFRKSIGPNWIVIPNTVVEFKGTDDKEITDYLNESNTFGFNYLDVTKKYLSFCGSFDYQTKIIVEIGQTNDSSFTTSFAPTWKSNLNNLKNAVYSAQYDKVFDFSASEDECLFTHYTNTLLNKVLAYNEDDDLQYRLIPHTNSRFAEVVPRGSVRDYLSLLKVLFKTNFPLVGTNTNLTYNELERILGYCPHYLYLKGELPFDLAEKIFYINGDTGKDTVSVYFRSLSLIVEGAKQTYKRNNTTYLLGSLASNLTCKVPEKLRENIKTTGTPLSKEEFGFVRYFLESLPQYEVDSASMYYTVKSSEHYLSKAKDSGLIVDFGRNYALTEYANMELSVLDRFALLQESHIDYSDSALDGVLSTLEDERGVVFNGSERQAFLTLNSNIGLIMANGVSNKDALEEAFHLMSSTENSTISNTVLVVKDYDAPSWVHARKVPVVKLSELNEDSFSENTMVLVHDANTWSLEDFYKLVQYNFKALYLFGNPYNSSNYFRTLALALPRAYTFSHTVVDMPLNIVNSGYLISLKGSKKVTFKYSPKLSTLDVLVRMLKTAFESGYSFENMYVISDLEKHFSAYKVSKKLVELLGYSEELQVGSPVYLDEKTLAWVTDLGKNKEGISVLIDGSSAPVTVKSSRLSTALCVTSDVAVRSPKDIAYVITQRGYGDYYTEDVYNSLDSVTKGVAFIGDEDFIKGTHFKVGTPNSTLLKKRLLK